MFKQSPSEILGERFIAKARSQGVRFWKRDSGLCVTGLYVTDGTFTEHFLALGVARKLGRKGGRKRQMNTKAGSNQRRSYSLVEPKGKKCTGYAYLERTRSVLKLVRLVCDRAPAL